MCALYYIYVHFREALLLKTTADYVGLAPEYFSSLFKKEIGRNYTEYLTGLKLDFAYQTLKSGFSVAEVCFLSGFGSVPNFNSTFKCIKGMTPSDYRKSADKKSE